MGSEMVLGGILVATGVALVYYVVTSSMEGWVWLLALLIAVVLMILGILAFIAEEGVFSGE